MSDDDDDDANGQIWFWGVPWEPVRGGHQQQRDKPPGVACKSEKLSQVQTRPAEPGS